METPTRPIPVVTLDPAGSDPRPPAVSTERRIVTLGVGAILGLTAIVVVVLNWQLIVTAALTLLLVGFLVLVAVCLLFRIATGGRFGSVILGSLVTAILMRRRR